MFPHHLENQMSHAPVTYHRMDVLPEAKTCYYTDTVSYADIWRKGLVTINATLFIPEIPKVRKFKILDSQKY